MNRSHGTGDAWLHSGKHLLKNQPAELPQGAQAFWFWGFGSFPCYSLDKHESFLFGCLRWDGTATRTDDAAVSKEDAIPSCWGPQTHREERQWINRRTQSLLLVLGATREMNRVVQRRREDEEDCAVRRSRGKCSRQRERQRPGDRKDRTGTPDCLPAPLAGS